MASQSRHHRGPGCLRRPGRTPEQAPLSRKSSTPRWSGPSRHTRAFRTRGAWLALRTLRLSGVWFATLLAWGFGPMNCPRTSQAIVTTNATLPQARLPPVTPLMSSHRTISATRIAKVIGHSGRRHAYILCPSTSGFPQTVDTPGTLARAVPSLQRRRQLRKSHGWSRRTDRSWQALAESKHLT